MPNNESTLTQLFTGIANAIRAKKNTNALIAPSNFATEIAGIGSSFSPLNMISWPDARNVTTSDYICAMWSVIRTGASGMVVTTNAILYYSYYDDINYVRDDPYIKIVNRNTGDETLYWRDVVNSCYIQVPFDFGDYQSSSTSHTNNGTTELDAATMLFRVS